VKQPKQQAAALQQTLHKISGTSVIHSSLQTASTPRWGSDRDSGLQDITLFGNKREYGSEAEDGVPAGHALHESLMVSLV
jgi:hypothetical protein